MTPEISTDCPAKKFSGSTLGVLTGTGPSTLLMSELPRSMIPTFLVPLFILLHLLALARREEVANTPADEMQASGVHAKA